MPEQHTLSTKNDRISYLNRESRLSHVKIVFSEFLKRVLPLSISWAMFTAVTATLDAIGPAAMASIGASTAISTYIYTGYSIGGAIAAALSGYIFNKVGRKIGLLIGAGSQLLSGIFALLDVYHQSQYLLLACSIFVGFGQGIGNFIRFSAAEVVPLSFKAQAITYVMTLGLIAAIVGPLFGTVLVTAMPTEFEASFIALLSFGILNVIFLVYADVKPFAASLHVTSNVNVPIRPLTTVLRSKTFISAVSIATLSQIFMVTPMSAVQLAMTKTYGYSFAASSATIVVHMFSCYAFGPVTGYLLMNYRAEVVAALGGVFAIVSFVVLYTNTTLAGFIGGMCMVGIAWNIGYSAGSLILLKSCYDDEHDLQKQVQASNDFILMSLTAGTTFCTGLILQDYGWHAVLIFGFAVIGLLFVMIAFTIWYKDEIVRLKRKPSVAKPPSNISTAATNEADELEKLRNTAWGETTLGAQMNFLQFSENAEIELAIVAEEGSQPSSLGSNSMQSTQLVGVLSDVVPAASNAWSATDAQDTADEAEEETDRDTMDRMDRVRTRSESISLNQVRVRTASVIVERARSESVTAGIDHEGTKALKVNNDVIVIPIETTLNPLRN